MEIPNKCDVLIVGAGPAGAMAALELAEHGISATLIDSKSRPAARPHCGEYCPRMIFSEFPLYRDCIYQKTECMVTMVNYQELSAPLAAPGYMIDRPAMDTRLVRMAADSGARVMSGVRFSGFEKGKAILRSGGDLTSVRAEIVIAADGANSTVARTIGLQSPDFLVGAQVEVPVDQPIDNTLIFFDQDFREGYGWLFPKKNCANVGIGVNAKESRPVKELLKNFIKKLISMGLTRPGVIARSGGLIPVSGPREKLVDGRIMFCGDAGGLTHPITGAGIGQALFSGRMAAHAIRRYLVTGQKGDLEEYQTEIYSKYGSVLQHAITKRRKLRDHWDYADFARLCSETWIGFSGYKKRERS